MRILILQAALALSLATLTAPAPFARADIHGPDHQRLLELTRQKIFSRLYTGQFEARIHHACSELESRDPTATKNALRWFQQLKADEAKTRLRCTIALSTLRNSLQNNWSKMRISLALARPRFLENRLLPDVNTRINVNAQHPFAESVTLPRLARSEQAAAIKIYEDEVSRLRALYRTQIIEKKGKVSISPPFDEFHFGEERFVLRELSDFRAAQERIYLGLLADLPILALVDSADPTPEALSAALARITHNTEELLEELKKSPLYDPDLLNEYRPLLDETSHEHPDLADAARNLRNEIERVRNRERYAEKTFVALLMLGSFVVDLEPFVMMIGATKLSFKAYKVLSARETERKRNAVFFSSVTKSMGITQLERMNDAQRESILAQVMLPLALVSAIDD